MIRYLPALIVLIWIVWLAAVLAQGHGANIFGPIRFNFESAGQFGDAFGSLSGFMASLAASGAWYAVHLQREELREEDKRREADDRNRKVQAFEQNFFQLLGHLTAIVRETDIEITSMRFPIKGEVDAKIYTGKDAYRRLLRSLRINFRWQEAPVAPEQFVETYEKFYVRFQDDLGHYFRILYHICNFVAKEEGVDRGFYMKLIFAQLSNSELMLLCYNCAFGRGRGKFSDIVERYGGFSNISFDEDIDEERVVLKGQFNPAAFQ